MVGREFSLALVTAARRDPVARLLPAIDEAVGHGLVDRIGRDYRFVHVLTRDAVEATLTTAELLALHRAVAEALQELFADDLSEHLADIARHWARLAPYGEAPAARAWAVRAADEAVRRLAYEEGVRLYRTALALDERLTTVERYHVLVALGRAAYFAGDPVGCADAAVAAMDLARRAASPELMGQAALVVEATPDLRGLAKQLCDDALAALGDDGDAALRARLLAQRGHLALFDGDPPRTALLTAAALDLARGLGDDWALGEALHARQEACPGPAGAAERLEALALGEQDRAVCSPAPSSRRRGRAHPVSPPRRVTTWLRRCSPATPAGTASGQAWSGGTPPASYRPLACPPTPTAPQPSSRDSTGPAPPGLGEREAEVALLVAQGLTNRQIAERLVISERTAENHVQHILATLGFATRSQIAAWSARTGA